MKAGHDEWKLRHGVITPGARMMTLAGVIVAVPRIAISIVAMSVRAIALAEAGKPYLLITGIVLAAVLVALVPSFIIGVRLHNRRLRRRLAYLAAEYPRAVSIMVGYFRRVEEGGPWKYPGGKVHALVVGDGVVDLIVFRSGAASVGVLPFESLETRRGVQRVGNSEMTALVLDLQQRRDTTSVSFLVQDTLTLTHPSFDTVGDLAQALRV